MDIDISGCCIEGVSHEEGLGLYISHEPSHHAEIVSILFHRIAA